MKYDYPFVECDEHDGPQLSYAVCRHVLNNKSEVYHVEKASRESMGLIECRRCFATGSPHRYFSTVCAKHCERAHWTTIKVH